jgi:hypothetical protein
MCRYGVSIVKEVWKAKLSLVKYVIRWKYGT